jgi:hypothetical protein
VPEPLRGGPQAMIRPDVLAAVERTTAASPRPRGLRLELRGLEPSARRLIASVERHAYADGRAGRFGA